MIPEGAISRQTIRVMIDRLQAIKGATTLGCGACGSVRAGIDGVIAELRRELSKEPQRRPPGPLGPEVTK